MSNDLDPIVGNWYKHLDKGQTFRVVAIDEDTATIEIQHFDGDLEQIDVDAWPEAEIEAAEEPEDWTGPVDEIDADELDYTETDMSARDWDESLEEAHAEEGEEWEDTRPEGERDDWAEGYSAEDLDGGDVAEEEESS